MRGVQVRATATLEVIMDRSKPMRVIDLALGAVVKSGYLDPKIKPIAVVSIIPI